MSDAVPTDDTGRVWFKSMRGIRGGPQGTCASHERSKPEDLSHVRIDFRRPRRGASNRRLCDSCGAPYEAFRTLSRRLLALPIPYEPQPGHCGAVSAAAGDAKELAQCMMERWNPFSIQLNATRADAVKGRLLAAPPSKGVGGPLRLCPTALDEICDAGSKQRAVVWDRAAVALASPQASFVVPYNRARVRF